VDTARTQAAACASQAAHPEGVGFCLTSACNYLKGEESARVTTAAMKSSESMASRTTRRLRWILIGALTPTVPRTST